MLLSKMRKKDLIRLVKTILVEYQTCDNKLFPFTAVDERGVRIAHSSWIEAANHQGLISFSDDYIYLSIPKGRRRSSR